MGERAAPGACLQQFGEMALGLHYFIAFPWVSVASGD